MDLLDRGTSIEFIVASGHRLLVVDDNQDAAVSLAMLEIDPVAGANVRRIYQLFAFESVTLDMLVERLAEEGLEFRSSNPRFPRSSLHTILRDRSYIGEVQHQGHWYPGKHEPLIDRSTWNRVQALLGGHVYRSHQLTYAGEVVFCGHCGHPITGEQKTKKSSTGERLYTYYRCAKYNRKGHPRIRVTEADLDRQILAIFDRMRVSDPNVREWFGAVLRSQTRDSQDQAKEQRAEVQRQLSSVLAQQDRLVNLRLNE